MIVCSSPSILISVPAYLPKRTVSPAFTASFERPPSLSSLPTPTATTRPRWGFSLAVSGRTMPPAVRSSASRRLIRTRSSRGFTFFAMFAISPLEVHPAHAAHVHVVHATHAAHAAHAGHTAHAPHAAHSAHSGRHA